ncbi:MAG: LCP family protein [Acutalibacteraceae bacterium]
MSEKKYQNDDDLVVSIEDDYIELLNSVEKHDDYEDVYSYSSDTNDGYIDVFSDSSSSDIYIGKNGKKAQLQDDGVYISKKRSVEKTSDKVSKANTNEIPKVKSAPVPPPPKKPKKQIDQDEISDFEAKHGRAGNAKKPAGVIAVAIILAIVIGFGAILFISASSIVSNFVKAEEIEHIEDVDSLYTDKNVRNVLLIGTDKESGGSARSDSIMIASVNKTTGRITICSILRDTHVDIPGEREAKINSAYSWGGANLLIKTIEQNFRIKIDDYATVNFEMFTKLIDGLGGIDVEVTEDEADYINNRHKYGSEKKPDYVQSGESVHLNGYQALWYSRIRKLDSDFMRTQRQRKVMTAIFTSAKDQVTPTGIFGLISTAKDVAPYIETTLSQSDFWNLAFSLAACLAKSGGNMDNLLVSQKIPFDDTWWYASMWDGSSIAINLEENQKLLYELLYENTEATVTEES